MAAAWRNCSVENAKPWANIAARKTVNYNTDYSGVQIVASLSDSYLTLNELVCLFSAFFFFSTFKADRSHGKKCVLHVLQDLLQIRSYVYAEEPNIDIHNFIGTFTRVSWVAPAVREGRCSPSTPWITPLLFLTSPQLLSSSPSLAQWGRAIIILDY